MRGIRHDLQTYLPLPRAGEGWTGILGITGPAILILAGAALFIGFLRGLPRWSFPYAGLLLGAAGLLALESRFITPLLISSLVSATLVFAAYRINSHAQPLPPYFQRLASSLWGDGSRLALASMALRAVDPPGVCDAVLNNQTPTWQYPSFSWRLAPCCIVRSRRPSFQLWRCGGIDPGDRPAFLDGHLLTGGWRPGYRDRRLVERRQLASGLWVASGRTGVLPIVIRRVKPGSAHAKAAECAGGL